MTEKCSFKGLEPGNRKEKNVENGAENRLILGTQCEK